MADPQEVLEQRASGASMPNQRKLLVVCGTFVKDYARPMLIQAGRPEPTDDAKDIALEFMIRHGKQGLTKLRGRSLSELRVLCHKAAHDGVQTLLRRWSVRKIRRMPLHERRLDAISPLGLAPDQAMEREELGRRLEAAMRRLPPKEQDAFRQFELEGMSYAEIAAAAGTSQGTIHQQVARARKKLQEMLAQDLRDWTSND